MLVKKAQYIDIKPHIFEDLNKKETIDTVHIVSEQNDPDILTKAHGKNCNSKKFIHASCLEMQSTRIVKGESEDVLCYARTCSAHKSSERSKLNKKITDVLSTQHGAQNKFQLFFLFFV